MLNSVLVLGFFVAEQALMYHDIVCLPSRYPFLRDLRRMYKQILLNLLYVSFSMGVKMILVNHGDKV